MQYMNQIILQLEEDRALHTIATNLNSKHLERSAHYIRRSSGQCERVGGKGEGKSDAETRVIVVGHSNGLSPIVSGLTPMQIADLIPITAGDRIKKVVLASCYSGGVPAALVPTGSSAVDCGKDLHLALWSRRKIKTRVVCYECMLATDAAGHKVKGFNPNDMQPGRREYKRTWVWGSGRQRLVDESPAQGAQDRMELDDIDQPGDPMDID